MTTPAERKAAERQRYRDAGLVAVTVYVKPEDRQAIHDLAERLRPRSAADEARKAGLIE
jgi:hypothetical protein